MKVAALQTDIVWEDPTANFAALRPRLREAAETGARLLVLPELFACGFSMNTAAIAESRDGESTAFLLDQARELGVWVCGSVPARQEEGALPHNSFVWAGPTGELHRYEKLHPFTYDGEHEHYATGTQLARVEIEGVRFTPFVCYDLRFADEFWQTAGATDCYVVVANWPEPRREHWRVLLRARAIENQAYVVGVNRVGQAEGGRRSPYAGDSAIIDPSGVVLAEAGREAALLVAEVDPVRVRETRAAFPVLQDRRTHRVGAGEPQEPAVTLHSAQPALPVADVERAFSFYESLGFRKHYQNGTCHILIERDGVIVHLATQIVEGVGGCQILVVGVDALYERALEAGARVLHEIQDEPWGTRDFTLLDPDGNAVTFAEARR